MNNEEIDPHKGPWILTATGQVFYFEHPEFHLPDIANHLEGINRFTGALKPGRTERITVAAHSLMVAHLVDVKFQRQALMHDAVEAYISDCNSPLKTLIPDYCKLERRLRNKLSLHYDIDFNEGIHHIKVADKVTADIERYLLLPESPHFNVEKIKGMSKFWSQKYEEFSRPGLFQTTALWAGIKDK